MLEEYRVALIGATGLVGIEIDRLLKKRKFPMQSLHCFSSSHPLNENSFDDIDIAFFATSSEISKEWIPLALQKKVLVIDSSSAFRKTSRLIIPEINHQCIEGQQLLCSPNCTTTIMCMVLAPIYRAFGIKRIIASTYQAMSGAGKKALEEFTLNRPTNVYLHESADEEQKINEETRKILGNPKIAISATCARVPTFRVHSIALNVECMSSFSLSEVEKLLEKTPGVILHPNASTDDASGKEMIFCSRVRRDPTLENGLDLWILGDQLLKGAALNAVQIAEEIDGIYSRRGSQSAPLCTTCD